MVVAGVGRVEAGLRARPPVSPPVSFAVAVRVAVRHHEVDPLRRERATASAAARAPRAAAPVGGPAAVLRTGEHATSAIAARAAIAQLAERRTRLPRRRSAGSSCRPRSATLVAEPQLDVRRERRDEVRARADDARLVRRLASSLLDRDRLALDLAGVDLEVRHRLAAERLDELDARVDLRQVVAALRRDGGRRRAGRRSRCGRRTRGAAGSCASACVGDRQLVAAEVDGDAAVHGDACPRAGSSAACR